MREATEPSADEAFARALSREIVASEILRAKVLVVALSVLVAVVMTAFVLGQDAIQKFVTRPVSWWVQLTFTGPFILYECFVVFILSRFAARERIRRGLPAMPTQPSKSACRR